MDVAEKGAIERADAKPRIYARLDRDLYNRVIREIPWGIRTEIFAHLIERFVDAHQKSPEILGMVLSGHFRVNLEMVEKDE